MYTCILFLLVVGALAAGVGGRKLGEKGAGILTSSCLIISLSWSVLVFYENSFKFFYDTYKIMKVVRF